MTPLSDALSRLAAAKPPEVRPTVTAAGPTLSASVVGESFADESVVASQELIAIAPPRVAEPAFSAQPGTESEPEPEVVPFRLPTPEGVVRLFCDALGDESLAFLTSAQTSDLVVHLDATESASTNEGSNREAAGLDGLRWPGGCLPATVSCADGLRRIRLRLSGGALAPLDWLLFLDDCRGEYAATTLIVDADAAGPIDWLAPRCDEVLLVAGAETTPAAHARRVAARLRQTVSVKPTCLLVRAA